MAGLDELVRIVQAHYQDKREDKRLDAQLASENLRLQVQKDMQQDRLQFEKTAQLFEIERDNLNAAEDAYNQKVSSLRETHGDLMNVDEMLTTSGISNILSSTIDKEVTFDMKQVEDMSARTNSYKEALTSLNRIISSKIKPVDNLLQGKYGSGVDDPKTAIDESLYDISDFSIDKILEEGKKNIYDVDAIVNTIGTNKLPVQASVFKAMKADGNEAFYYSKEDIPEDAKDIEEVKSSEKEFLTKYITELYNDAGGSIEGFLETDIGKQLKPFEGQISELAIEGVKGSLSGEDAIMKEYYDSRMKGIDNIIGTLNYAKLKQESEEATFRENIDKIDTSLQFKDIAKVDAVIDQHIYGSTILTNPGIDEILASPEFTGISDTINKFMTTVKAGGGEVMLEVMTIPYKSETYDQTKGQKVELTQNQVVTTQNTQYATLDEQEKWKNEKLDPLYEELGLLINPSYFQQKDQYPAGIAGQKSWKDLTREEGRKFYETLVSYKQEYDRINASDNKDWSQLDQTVLLNIYGDIAMNIRDFQKNTDAYTEQLFKDGQAFPTDRDSGRVDNKDTQIDESKIYQMIDPVNADSTVDISIRTTYSDQVSFLEDFLNLEPDANGASLLEWATSPNKGIALLNKYQTQLANYENMLFAETLRMGQDLQKDLNMDEYMNQDSIDNLYNTGQPISNNQEAIDIINNIKTGTDDADQGNDLDQGVLQNLNKTPNAEKVSTFIGERIINYAATGKNNPINTPIGEMTEEGWNVDGISFGDYMDQVNYITTNKSVFKNTEITPDAQQFLIEGRYPQGNDPAIDEEIAVLNNKRFFSKEGNPEGVASVIIKAGGYNSVADFLTSNPNGSFLFDENGGANEQQLLNFLDTFSNEELEEYFPGIERVTKHYDPYLEYMYGDTQGRPTEIITGDIPDNQFDYIPGNPVKDSDVRYTTLKYQYETDKMVRVSNIYGVNTVADENMTVDFRHPINYYRPKVQRFALDDTSTSAESWYIPQTNMNDSSTNVKDGVHPLFRYQEKGIDNWEGIIENFTEAISGTGNLPRAGNAVLDPTDIYMITEMVRVRQGNNDPLWYYYARKAAKNPNDIDKLFKYIGVDVWAGTVMTTLDDVAISIGYELNQSGTSDHLEDYQKEQLMTWYTMNADAYVDGDWDAFMQIVTDDGGFANLIRNYKNQEMIFHTDDLLSKQILSESDYNLYTSDNYISPKEWKEILDIENTFYKNEQESNR